MFLEVFASKKTKFGGMKTWVFALKMRGVVPGSRRKESKKCAKYPVKVGDENLVKLTTWLEQEKNQKHFCSQVGKNQQCHGFALLNVVVRVGDAI